MDNNTGIAKTVSKIPKPAQIEDALTITGFGKFNYFLIIVSGVMLVTVLLETLGMGFVLPVAECDLDITTQQKGILSAIGFMGVISSSHLWGFLADTRGRRKVILPALILSFMCSIISSMSNSIWMLALFRFLNGFFISGPSSTVYAYLGEFHNSQHRSRVIMGASIIFGVACMALPALAWVVIGQDWSYDIPWIGMVFKPWRLFLIVCGLPAFLCSIALIWIPESPKFLLAQGKNQETFEILAWMYSINTGKSAKEFPVASIIDEYPGVSPAPKPTSMIQSMWMQTSPLFRGEHLKMTLIACTLQFGIFTTSNGMYMWFPHIINKVADFQTKYPDNGTTICDIMQTFGRSTIESTEKVCQMETMSFSHSLICEAGYAVGFTVIGLIINLVGKLSIIVFTLVFCGVCGIICILVTNTTLAGYLFLVLMLCGIAIPVINAASVDMFPTQLRAMAVCISLMFGRLGSVAGSNIVGALLDNYCDYAFVIISCWLLICGVLAFFIPNIHTKTDLRRTSISSR